VWQANSGFAGVGTPRSSSIALSRFALARKEDESGHTPDPITDRGWASSGVSSYRWQPHCRGLVRRRSRRDVCGTDAVATSETRAVSTGWRPLARCLS